MFVSFYSYKGGVGRTQLLVNAASYLCFYKHKKVLMLEWDLEAPGLHYYFGKKNGDITKNGLIELLDSYMQIAHRGAKILSKDLPYFTEDHIVKNLAVSKTGQGCVDLIPCANYSQEYTQKLNDFDWQEFTELRNGNVYIDFLKTKLKELNYDFIFIDSRTGISDYSGLCNILLPDMNVIVIAPTEQNFEGALKITKAIAVHPYLTEGHRKPFILPILSRIDNQTDRHKKWLKQFETDFSFTLKSLIAEDLYGLSEQIFNDIYIPLTVLFYNRAMSVGENILFDQEAESKNRIEAASQYENIANFISELKENNKINISSRVSEELLEKWGVKTKKDKFSEEQKQLLKQLIDENRISELFEEFDKIIVSSSDKSTYTYLKQEFILGAVENNFYERLKIFINSLK